MDDGSEVCVASTRVLSDMVHFITPASSAAVVTVTPVVVGAGHSTHTWRPLRCSGPNWPVGHDRRATAVPSSKPPCWPSRATCSRAASAPRARWSFLSRRRVVSVQRHEGAPTKPRSWCRGAPTKPRRRARHRMCEECALGKAHSLQNHIPCPGDTLPRFVKKA